ncbi:MAG TPA: UDP-N-acetylglucosamine 1-carboxyvinyltransferase [Chloroflexota bacterium]|nr:UDP-N-acetylglucosamine 1-carboxyvinyltransferase [Chloroflexota bacterium]
MTNEGCFGRGQDLTDTISSASCFERFPLPRFLIQGGKPLSGTVEVAANKNAILPMMAATLLTEAECVIRNVPRIADVYVMADLLRSVGAGVEFLDDRSLRIQTEDVRGWAPAEELVEKLRASVLMAGPLLARFGRWSMRHPGGDAIGTRSIQTHLEAFRALGATVDARPQNYDVRCAKLEPAPLFLDEVSVTATENLMMLATRVPGTTVIKNAACEPHIVNLAEMLTAMGASIEGAGTNVVTVHGGRDLGSVDCQVWPDHTEAGTFAALAAACGGPVRILNVVAEHLEMVLLVLSRMGVDFELEGRTMCVRPSDLVAVPQIVTGPWPNFPTDLASVFIVLATQARGMTMVHDWMYESRMFFIDRLKDMGAKIVLADPHRCVTSGPSELHAREFVSPDIRAGIALVMASLIARGDGEIDRIELIDRGYERIDERLRALGAEIQRVD